MHRRNILIGLSGLCTCGWAGHATAQFPDPQGLGDLGQSQSAEFDGCANLPHRTITRKSDVVFFRPDSDKRWEVIDDIGGACKANFDIRVELLMYDDYDGTNAYATRDLIDTTVARNLQGTVLLGRRLAEAERRRSKNWKAALLMVLAHECGHILQYQHGFTKSTVQLELQADFLAGWGIGREGRVGKAEYVDLAAAEACLRGRGGRYKFNNPLSHGTPDQRVAALRAGYRTAEQGGRYPPFDEGLRYVGLA